MEMVYLRHHGLLPRNFPSLAQELLKLTNFSYLYAVDRLSCIKPCIYTQSFQASFELLIPRIRDLKKPDSRMENARRRQKRIRRLQSQLRAANPLENGLSPSKTAYIDDADNTLNITPKLPRSPRQRRKRVSPTSFSRLSHLPTEIRIEIWKNTLRGRIIKLSPKLWDPEYECRNTHWAGQVDGTKNRTCVTHSHPETKPPATFSASFEAREETMRFYRPLKLGQLAATRPIWANLDIDTISINDCLGPIGRGNALLSSSGFGPSLLESPDWYQIQHLALDWTNYRCADVARGTRRVLTKEILKMRSIKTLTIIGDYTWNAPNDATDNFVEMGDDFDEANTTKLIRIDEDETAAAAHERFRTKVEAGWAKSLKLVSLANIREGMTALPVVELRVKTMKMASGHIDKYWDKD
jgi:hypothetical protein